jgi:hypothetical protein
MDEANYRLQQTPNVAQARTMGKAVKVLAIREAIKAVKQRMHAEGLKVHHVPRKIIVAAADDYLANHRSELVAEATKIVERWHTEGAFGPRGGFRSRS